MEQSVSMCKEYTGDKKRVCDFIKKKKVVKTGEIVEKLNILPKKAWQITNELERDGIISSM